MLGKGSTTGLQSELSIILKVMLLLDVTIYPGVR